MPFQETCVVDERARFIQDVQRSLHSMAELCRRYGISRKTGYKWLNRWWAEGPAGLEDRSSRPKRSPWATPPEVVGAILQVRRRYPDYGAKKIRWYLERNRPELELPSLTTIHNILHRHGLVPKRRKRRRRWHPGRPDTTIDGARPVFTRLFKEYGLPARIRSDNGTPFASNALGRLSRLSVWFIQLGIYPEFIEPGQPQQNGTHENMHLVLKRRTTRPPSATHRTQQRAFGRFKREFNHVRPHEALEGKVPADLYRPSPRPFPKTLEPLTYPGHFVTRLVSDNGGIRWYTQRVPVSTILKGHDVGLEEIDHGLFDVYFGPVWIGRFIEEKGIIVDSRGPGAKRHGAPQKRTRL